MTEQTTSIQQKKYDVAADLQPNSPAKRNIGPFSYMSMWLGDGFNIGNITLGSSIVVAGVATMNLIQTITAAAVAIMLIAVVFILNDRFGYRTGVPYVMQLRMSFGEKGAKWASLLRGIPGIVWFGFQSWTGALALGQIFRILTHGKFSNVWVCFIVFVIFQVLLALKGFKSIKIVSEIISVIVMIGFLVVLYSLLSNEWGAISQNLVHKPGSWGGTFWGFVVAFLGNYTAIILSAADYSREVKAGYSDVKRFFLYFTPIFLAYGATIVTGAMLAAVTGISSPVNAIAKLFDSNGFILAIEGFIVLGVITTNMVANIMPPAYVISSLFKVPQGISVALIGLLGILSCPWILVQDSSSAGLDMFIKAYSIFLGPVTAILIIEYYVIRKHFVDLDKLYDSKNMVPYSPNAPIALFTGAAAAFAFSNVSWLVGFFVGGLVYWLLAKYRPQGNRVQF